MLTVEQELKLLNCPFCGKDAQQITRFTEVEEVGYLAARCPEHTHWITVEQWNRRVAPPLSASFQDRVAPWMQECFGPEISRDTVERNHRFLEESLELVQACGCVCEEAHQLVDYVFNRPQGDINQEVGGVMVTLAALCLANGFDMHAGGETELARIWTKIEQIRAKQAAKPKHSPLPTVIAPPLSAERDAERYRWLRSRSTVPYPSDLNKGELQNLIVFWDGPDELDAAIDSAIAQQEGRG